MNRLIQWRGNGDPRWYHVILDGLGSTKEEKTTIREDSLEIRTFQDTSWKMQCARRKGQSQAEESRR